MPGMERLLLKAVYVKDVPFAAVQHHVTRTKRVHAQAAQIVLDHGEREGQGAARLSLLVVLTDSVAGHCAQDGHVAQPVVLLLRQRLCQVSVPRLVHAAQGQPEHDHAQQV